MHFQYCCLHYGPLAAQERSGVLDHRHKKALTSCSMGLHICIYSDITTVSTFRPLSKKGTRILLHGSASTYMRILSRPFLARQLLTKNGGPWSLSAEWLAEAVPANDPLLEATCMFQPADRDSDSQCCRGQGEIVCVHVRGTRIHQKM